MTNVWTDPSKGPRRRRMFNGAVSALKKQGWNIERVPGERKSSVRRITKGAESKLVSIRTTQDTWIAFPREDDDKSWRTLSEVDVVVAVSVDPKKPGFANVHMIDGDEMRSRFDRTYAARLAANHVIPVGRGVWVALYEQEDKDVPRLVGAGAGVKHPPIDSFWLNEKTEVSSADAPEIASSIDGAPLTVAEAKERLAATFGVSPENVKITIEA